MGKLEKNIFKITWPIFIEMLFYMLLGTVDTIMLSRYSDLAIGSVGVSNQLLFLFGVVVNIVAIGIGVVASQYLGARKEQEAKDTVVTGVVTNTLIGVLLSLVVIIFARTLLQLIGTEDVLMKDSISYLKIVGASLTFVALRVALSTGFRAFSKPRITMFIMVVGNIINIGINAVLIYGLFGLPSLGVTGAAIGTLVSRIIIAVLIIIYTYKYLNIKVLKFRLHINHLKKILYIGIPSAAENILWSLSQVIVVYFLNKISVEGDAVIARTYIYTVLSFIYVFSFSVANGNSVIVGYYLGEKNPDQAYKQTLNSLYLAFGLVVVMTVLVNIFGTEIMSIFTDDPKIIGLARSVLHFAIFIEIGRAMNMVYIQALRTAGDTIFPVIMGAISMYGIHVFLAYVFAIHLEMGIIGIFLAGMTDELFRGLTMAYRWYRRGWTELQLLHN